MAIVLRQARSEDAEICGRICYEAFHDIATRHNFPPELPSPDVAIGILSMMFSHPGFYGVVAENDGRIVGSNVLDERCSIAGIGPITVSPDGQNHSLGRELMSAVLERASARKFRGVRLVQAAYHNRSLSLYTKLGFQTREPLSCIYGQPLRRKVAGYEVRRAVEADIAPCNAICARVHGHTRDGELRDAVAMGSAVVVEHAGSITGYATGFGYFGHAVGETDNDLEAMISAAAEFGWPGFLLPTRSFELMRWCLTNGLRVVQPMTLMTVGLYNEPHGSYLPSILY